MALVLASAMAALSAAGPAATVAVSLQPALQRFIHNISTLDRMKWFNVHSAPGNSVSWRPEDVAQFDRDGYRAHLGREFAFSGILGELREDPNRPGYVDAAQLAQFCADHPKMLGNWTVDEVDMVMSSKVGAWYPNHCGDSALADKGSFHPFGHRAGNPRSSKSTGSPPFVPGSHDATADYFSHYFAHCLFPTSATRVLVEVANECNVHVSNAYPPNTTHRRFMQQRVAQCSG